MVYKILFQKILILYLVFFCFFCSKTKKKSYDHIFLLKEYTHKNLVKAPNLKGINLPGRLKRILENRSEENFLPQSVFIKKIKCLTETRTALFAPVGTTYEFPVDLNEGAILKFGFAIDDIYSEERRVPIEFNVLIVRQNKGNDDSFYSEILFSNNPADLGWHDRSMPIKNISGKVKIRFVTNIHIPIRDPKEIFAYWSHLVVLNPTYKKKNKPNVILISLDTLRADHLEIYNYKRETAPDMTRYASDFVIFKNCWSQWCRTLESHQSIMTGLYEVEHKIPEHYNSTPSHLVTLAELMKTKDYITAAFTGASRVSANYGFCKGFDSYYDNEFWKGDGVELPENWQRAKTWLKENAGTDFFLFFHTYQIHGPYKTDMIKYDNMFNPANKGYDLPDLRIKRIGKEKDVDKIVWSLASPWKPINAGDQDIIQGLQDYYDGSIRFTNDYFIKDLILYLKQLGIYNDTIVVILSDHGEEFFDHGGFEHKDGVYEENIHVPLLIKFPHSRFGGKIITENVQTIDVLPTLMEMLGIKFSHKVSGKSLVRLIKGKTNIDSRKRLVYSQSPSRFAVKKDKLKLILKARVDNSLQGKIRRIEIYDLAKDPKELHPIKIDDLSEHKYLYNELFHTFILKKGGIHIIFSETLKGKDIDGTIDIPLLTKQIKTSYEIGVTKTDSTLVREDLNQITFNWKMSDWKKSIILVPRDNLKIRLKIKIDGKAFTDITLHQSILTDGEYLTTSGKQYTFLKGTVAGDIFIFANSIKQRSEKKDDYPGMSKENLEKLKTLGYIQ
jgi:arylsulfatase A-like enzyme